MGEVHVITGGKAHLVAGQQEDFTTQSVCAGRHRTIASSAVLIRDFHLFDGVLDVIVEQVQEGAVQIGMDVGVLVVVVRAVPMSGGLYVLQQQPSAVAALVIQAGRLALMHDQEVSRRTAKVQFDSAAD